MHRLMSSFRFMLLWIPATIFALVASLVAFAVILFGGSLLAMLIWGEEITLAPVTILLAYSFVMYALMGLAMGFLYGSVQKALLRQKTDEVWRGWRTASVIGSIIGVVITIVLIGGQLAQYITWLVLPPPEALLIIGLSALTIPFACMSMAQFFVLRQHVDGAWTWILANIVGGIVMFSLIATGVYSIAATPLLTLIALLAVSAAPGIVTGFAMLWLLNFNWKHDYLDY